MSGKDEVIAAVTTMHTANLNALLVLVQTLEEAGLIQAEHYAGNLTMHADLHASKLGPAVTALLKDFAERLGDREEGGSA